MKIKSVIFSFALIAVSAAPALAQFSFGGDKPIDIKAEKATYEANVTVLEGNVEVQQGDARIFADHMTIYRKSADDASAADMAIGIVTRIEAEGNFKYRTPDNTVEGDKGVYIRESGRIIVTGDVVLVQPSGSRVRGEKLTYNIENKSAKFGDECIGENCSGRVTFDIQQ